MNSNSWNGQTLYSILVCGSSVIFEDGSSFTIGAHIDFYDSIDGSFIESRSDEIEIFSNSRPDVETSVCSITPTSGLALDTDFVLDCDRSLIDDSNTYTYKFQLNIQ